MTPQNTRAMCGTAMIIASVAVKALAGGSLEVLGLAIVGLLLLGASLIPPIPPQMEGGIQHGYYR